MITPATTTPATITQVERYGVHWAPGRLAHLQQTRGGQNAVGARQSSPFRVRTRTGRACNHLVALNATNPAREHLGAFAAVLAHNALARFMLPLPKDACSDTRAGVGVLTSDDHAADMLVLTLLAKMSSPVRLPLAWADATDPHAVLDELEATDVQPFVLAGVRTEHAATVSDLVRAAGALPRRLLVVAESGVPLRGEALGADHLFAQDEAALIALPWESLGACVLRAYMRDEWSGAWFTREPIPGNETKERWR